MQQTNYKNLSATQIQLLDAAEAVMSESYNSYSKFRVGAALLTPDGQIVTGTNFENAAYGSSTCAERAAIVRANAMGLRNFDAIAIIGKGDDFETEDVVAPCGACRQVIYELSELADQDIEVIMSNSRKTKIVIASIKVLLPLAFGAKDLGINLSST